MFYDAYIDNSILETIRGRTIQELALFLIFETVLFKSSFYSRARIYRSYTVLSNMNQETFFHEN